MFAEPRYVFCGGSNQPQLDVKNFDLKKWSDPHRREKMFSF